MTDFSIKGPAFDGAWCTVDTFRHLLTDQEAINHLQNVARHLKKNSIYVLGIHLLPRQGIQEKLYRWKGSRGTLTVYSSIAVLDVDRGLREETLRYTLRTDRQKYKSVYKLRTYTLQQFQELLDKAGCFEIMSVYDLDYDLEHPFELSPESDEAVFLLSKI